jgi:ankyrin repeat protein
MNDYSQPPSTPEPNKGNEEKRAQPATPSRNDPKWSIRSLKIQVIAFIILVASCFVFREEAIFVVIFIFVPFYVFCSVLGFVFAGKSFARKERLSWLALLLNAPAVLLLVFGLIRGLTGGAPLYFAVVHNHKDMVKFLLACGADANAKGFLGQTPLDAVRQKDIAELLLAHGADVNAKNGMGDPPLVMQAIGDGYGRGDRKDIVEMLLAHGADVNGKNDQGETPLYWAEYDAHTDLVELLLTNKSDVNARDRDGQTPLFWPASSGYVELLLAHGADVNATNYDGDTPFLNAVRNEREDVAKLLLAHGADVNGINTKDREGRTPLYKAAIERHKDMVEFLLANKADVNATNNDGKTPLQAAAFGYSDSDWGDPEIVELLLANKADVNAKDRNGSTPLQIAQKHNRWDLVKLLRQYGGHE